MSKLGDLLRQHRERKGMSLEGAAFAVELEAKKRGIPETSKKIPRTHASLSRWETGKVEIKELGLEILAAAYGLTPDDLRRPPPPEGSQPSKRVDVPADQAQAVEAFIEAIRKRAG